jgi:predicted GIY-YIG superfamily endonuclease
MAYYVYLLASRKRGTLYLGVTKDIVRRGYEHRTKAIDGFTTRCGVGSRFMMMLQLPSRAKKNSRNGLEDSFD